MWAGLKMVAGSLLEGSWQFLEAGLTEDFEGGLTEDLDAGQIKDLEANLTKDSEASMTLSCPDQGFGSRFDQWW